MKKHLILILIAFIFPVGVANSQMQSANFRIPEDSVSAGGQRQSSDSFYSMESIGEMGTGESESANYITDTGFWAMVGNEEVLTFSITDNEADLGTLSSDFIRYDTAAFRAATTSKNGYVIEFFGNPLGFEADVINPLSSPSGPITGTEQFGFNLRYNTSPTVGANPTGGNGQAAAGYNVQNSYKFNSGDIIAEASQPSVYTDYTASFIGNISEISDAGEYVSNITVVITGRY